MDKTFEAWEKASKKFASSLDSFDDNTRKVVKRAMARTLAKKKEEALERIAAAAGHALPHDPQKRTVAIEGLRRKGIL